MSTETEYVLNAEQKAAIQEYSINERILACVKACEGISNTALEAGAVKELVEKCNDLKGLDRDQIRSNPGGVAYLIAQIFAALAKLEGKV